MSHPATPQAAFKPFRTELGWCGVAWHGPRLLRVQIGHLTRRDVGQCWQADNWSTVTGSSVAAAQATNNAARLRAGPDRADAAVRSGRTHGL